ncbi:unnamed protein product [Macrosiphum euphorbiae]|uniref:CCHC-type domain-containing protein n=1 Tax=Macrosiphum euphorbiae TaxID=13131 RepID=A0AAV0WW82_9HEMI|nr:unnamed protein product [Macrosiphum euphorbiae]
MDSQHKINSTPGGELAKPGNPLSEETGPTDSGGGQPSIVPTTVITVNSKKNTDNGKSGDNTITRAQAEAKYTKLLGDTQTHLEALEAAVQAASNTKLDIKNGIRALGICFREFQNSARMIGMTRNPDATELRVRNLQHQQQTQHAQTTKLINTIREEQLQHQQSILQKIEELTQKQQVVDHGDDMQGSQDRFNSQDERLACQDRKLDKIISDLDRTLRPPADMPQQRQHQQQPEKHPKQATLPVKRKKRQPSQQVQLEKDQEHHQEQEQGQERDQPQSQQQPTWSQVVGRTRKKNPRPQAPRAQPSSADKIALLRRRAPKTAAVIIDSPVDGGSLATLMKKVAGAIDLKSLGVNVLTTRKTRTGGILLEVVGADKADLLADKIRAVSGDSARVRLPVPRTPVLLLGIPEWAEADEVADVLARLGIPDVAADEVKIWRNTGGRAELVASLSLPLKDAIALAESKAVVVGWTKCRVKLLDKRQPTCYRCQQKGHLAAECQNESKARRCHRCQGEDHLVSACTRKQQQKQPAKTRDPQSPASNRGETDSSAEPPVENSESPK